MAERTGKGSIFLKFIIFILIIVLIGAIMIPKQMWDAEARNTEICQQRMSSLLNAELLYQKHKDAYCPSLDSLIAFFKDDLTQYQLEFVNLDTILDLQLIELVKGDSLVQVTIDTIAADTTMSDILKTITIDYFLAKAMVGVIKNHDAKMTAILNPVIKENIEDKMAPSMAIQKLAEVRSAYDIIQVCNKDDSLAAAIKQIKPNLTMVHYLPKIRRYESIAKKIDNFYTGYLDSLYNCPTVNKPYHIEIAGSTIVFSNIFCPVDSLDSLKVATDFWKKKIGGLTVKNHGNISSGAKSWEESY